MVDKAGAISICAYSEGDECADMFVRNNLVAGSVYGGFVMPGHDCGDTSGRYSGNVAHSIHGMKSGNGLFIKNAPSQTECTEFSNFKAYKCYYQGAFAYPDSKTLIFQNMTMVDNREGFGANIANKPTEFDMDTVDMTFRNIKIYGESSNPDCPQNGGGGFCHQIDKYGLLSSSGTYNNKDFHIGAMSPLPPHKIKSIASFGTKIELYNMQFFNF